MSTKATAVSVAGDLGILAEDFERHLRVSKSPKTVKTYLEAVRGLDRFLAAQGMPRKVETVRREHVEAYILDLMDRWTPGTASNRYRSLRQFFRWCVEEGEIKSSPMANMEAPKIPETRPPVLTDDELAKLLATAEGNSFADRRDRAMMRVLIDTGCRASELVNLTTDDLNLDNPTVRLVGKGSKERVVHLGAKSVHALIRYMRSRRQHEYREMAWLWVGERGRITDSGLRQMLERRGSKAGVENVHAHRFRHAAADAWLKAGGSQVGLEAAMGWTGPAMVRRYAKAEAQNRAQMEHERLAPGDRV
jgi:site-specific recombinase XerD